MTDLELLSGGSRPLERAPAFDTDPEDAYDASDPIDVRLAVIARAILSARTDRTRRVGRLAALAGLLRRIADDLEAD